MNFFLQPHGMHAAFDWAWKTSLAASVLILFVWVIHGCLGKMISPRWRYVFGLLILVRLLIPAVPAVHWNVLRLPSYANKSIPAQYPVSSVEAFSSNLAQPEFTRSVALDKRRAQLRFEDLPSLVWLLGAAISLTLVLYRQWRFKRRVEAFPLIFDSRVATLMEEAKQALGWRGPVRLVQGVGLGVPVVFGFRKPIIILPEALLQDFSRDELRGVLLHELVHVKRRDVLLNWVLIAARSLHWFNPLVWIAMKRLRADRELVCDEAVLKHLDEGGQRVYGNTLIKLLAEHSGFGFSAGVVPIINNKKEIKRRVIMIAQFKPGKRATVVIPLLLVGTLCGFTFTRAAGPAAKAKSEPPAAKADTDEAAFKDSNNNSRQNASRVLKLLREELDHKENEVRAAAEKVDALREKLNIPSDVAEGKTSSPDASMIQRINSEIANAKAESLRIQTLIDAFGAQPRNYLPALISTAQPDALLSSLQERLAEAEQRLAGQQGTLADNHPELKQTKLLIAKIESQITSRIEGTLVGMKALVNANEARVNQLRVMAEKEKALETENARRYRSYFEARRELEMMERIRDTVRLRLLQEQVDMNRLAPGTQE